MNYVAPTTEGWTSQSYGTNPGGYNPSGGHTGEDIAVPLGTELVAMADGVVVHAGYFSGAYSDNPWWIMPSFAGFVVTIDYGPYLSHYAHCSASPVRTGQRVTQGQTVAYSGNTGSATSGPHCHWEVMPDGFNLGTGTYGRINPRSLLSTITTSSTPTSTEDDMSAAAEAQISRVLQILEAQEGDRLRERIIAIDDRTAVASDALKYIKGADEASLYAFEDGKVRGITLVEWQASGLSYRELPQSIVDALPRVSA